MRIATQVPGAKVTGLTISNEQYAEARTRVKAAGLEVGAYDLPPRLSLISSALSPATTENTKLIPQSSLKSSDTVNDCEPLAGGCRRHRHARLPRRRGRVRQSHLDRDAGGCRWGCTI
jgi:hypothetical protein